MNKRYNLIFIVQNSVKINKRMIAVSIAYRLSPYGFFNGDEVVAEKTLNLGLEDQRLARDDGLFRAAIMQSQPDRELPIQVRGVVAEAGCSHTDHRLDFDGDFVARYPSEQVDDGYFVRCAHHRRDTTDEGSTRSPKPVNTTEELRSQMNTTSSYQLALPGSLINALLSLYANTTTFGIPSSAELGGNVTLPQHYGAAFRQSAAYFGDQVFTAPRRKTCQAWAAHSLSAYCYRFNTKPATTSWVGVAHFSDVAFVLYNLNRLEYSVNPFAVGNLTHKYIELSYLMAGSWASFVPDLDPNSWRGTGRNAIRAVGGESGWPVYTVDRPRNMVFDANVTNYVEVDDWREKGIALINEAALAYGR
ncbi:Alpha/Beta hydrolase protein [Aspergillus nidulans var. acristatus]